ncbi:MAG: tRNA (adenosine(37)-N6)-threonylcarbamoyltransferase complex transferase subunit TsaD [Candidatus Gracilibacteria bacterium]|nr:tRNA (adenosine(37)-N6)-threonylcarbamoyltransferase complex transferase subunit TsaD [Candidatus Gracilibacteria bacterium]
MKILSIETSCDETSVAIVEDGRKVLANVIASQIDLHAKTGGVVPEVAAREHVLKIIPVLDECLTEAKCGWDDIDALAITKGPGLVSSLIIGTETANVISFVKNKPMIPVQHIVGHIYSNWLEDPESIKACAKNGIDSRLRGNDREKGNDSPRRTSGNDAEPQFPIIILTVSGGHNELVLMRDHHKFEILGETRDDASGEAFDKVARILGLGYPGGPVISKSALNGDNQAFDLPKSYLEKDSLDFSFSGLKTAVLNEVKSYAKNNSVFSEAELPEKFKNDLSASFQEAVVEVLSDKLIMAYEKYPEVRELHLSGGVSANTRLREVIESKLPKTVKFRHPKSLKFCTDNAAMIASAAYYLYKLNPKKFKPATNIIPSTSFEIESL